MRRRRRVRRKGDHRLAGVAHHLRDFAHVGREQGSDHDFGALADGLSRRASSSSVPASSGSRSSTRPATAAGKPARAIRARSRRRRSARSCRRSAASGSGTERNGPCDGDGCKAGRRRVRPPGRPAGSPGWPVRPWPADAPRSPGATGRPGARPAPGPRRRPRRSPPPRPPTGPPRCGRRPKGLASPRPGRRRHEPTGRCGGSRRAAGRFASRCSGRGRSAPPPAARLHRGAVPPAVRVSSGASQGQCGPSDEPATPHAVPEPGPPGTCFVLGALLGKIWSSFV